MIQIVFKRNSGSYRVGRIASFQPALADFFVSKLRVAEYYEPPQPVAPTFNEFALPEGDDLLSIGTDVKQTKRSPKKQAKVKSGSYLTRDMKAAD